MKPKLLSYLDRMDAELDKASTCEKRKDGDGWWICDRCGSLWAAKMMGNWIPLSCPDRNRR